MKNKPKANEKHLMFHKNKEARRISRLPEETVTIWFDRMRDGNVDFKELQII